ncbi:SPASM domain-containing protein [Vibrio crassostreae]|uniref:SPASM domain-containing protein n=1 Tax=Vibrio crassostreae TaxID=246167 RepID=UPI001B30B64F
MNNSFSIHYRITKRCNANCDYCSSSGKSNLEPISKEDFRKTIDFLVEKYLPRFISEDSFITLNYLGGEVLTLKKEHFLECVHYARKRFSENYRYRDGIQTNLIGSERMIREYKSVFGKNIGTSIDTYSGKRKIGNSSERYNKLMNQNVIAVFKEHPPSTFVVDEDSARNLKAEYDRSQKLNYDLVLRPIIKCGSNAETGMDREAETQMVEAFNWWLATGKTRVEPFYSMLNKKISTAMGSGLIESNGCHFQNNCIENNVNIDPDGKIYLCNEMADAGIFQIGDAIKGVVDEDTIVRLDSRKTNIDFDCITCEHFKECKAGCMYTGFEKTGRLSGKDSHCVIWKSIFSKIDTEVINTETLNERKKWLESL